MSVLLDSNSRERKPSGDAKRFAASNILVTSTKNNHRLILVHREWKTSPSPSYAQYRIIMFRYMIDGWVRISDLVRGKGEDAPLLRYTLDREAVFRILLGGKGPFPSLTIGFTKLCHNQT